MGIINRYTGIKGLSNQQIKTLGDTSRNHVRIAQAPSSRRLLGGQSGRVTGPPSHGRAPKSFHDEPRPSNKLLTTLATDVHRVILPEAGSFNAGMVKIPNSKDYVMVYRPNEYKFVACILDENLVPKPNSFFKFAFSNCADPRIIWTPDNKLLMIYSSTSGAGLYYECIRGGIIMDLNESTNFFEPQLFKVSPDDIVGRQKNWMPFIHDDKIYLIGTVCPHIVYELTLGDQIHCEKKFETSWLSPWIFKEFLRGNTNAVRLDDGNYLGTFHTATWFGGKCYYDNGCYLFSGEPPFKVLKFSNRTYLKGEDAIEAYFRNANRIACTFPVGMVREDKKILISYGDNDSVVKIMKTTVDDMLGLMLDVY